MAAIKAHAADEDDSRGYALSTYPPLREKELALRAYALKDGPILRQVLESASDTEQRAAAAEALGYAQQSTAQITALVKAARDPNEIVRNNATRALVVLAASSPKVARQIPANDFIAMLGSGIWTDRNKASFLLMYLTQDRDSRLLAELRERALPALIEIAHWDKSHAQSALTLLGRITGIPEERLEKMDADAIIRAVQK